MRHLTLSKFKSSPVSQEVTSSEKSLLSGSSDQDASTTPTLHTPLPPPNLKVKKVDHYFSRWQKKWKYENTGANIIPEFRHLPETSSGSDDPWQGFCFVVIREIPREQDRDPWFKIQIKSPYLVQACKEVVKEMVGLSWNAIPLQVRFQLRTSCYQRLYSNPVLAGPSSHHRLSSSVRYISRHPQIQG
jgi:hypothetical protein